MLQFIVGRLKEKPFNISIRAVDFDDKHPDEHLQILNDVLASLNAELKADIRTASRDEAIEDMRHFLVTHKCTFVPQHNAGFVRKESIYQMLHWVLSNYEILQKEEYLARYLRPVEVPSEYIFMQTNENLRELFDAYKELQAEFVEVHKQFTTTNAGHPTNDILELIDQLEAEKRQLQDRLQKEQAQVSINGDFQRLLVQASNMRQAQDDELRLERQREEQLLSLTFAKQRLKQANRMLKLIESCEGKPIEIVIDHLGHEYQQSVHHLEANTIPERQNAELRLLQASKTKPDLDRVGVDCVSDDGMMPEIHELLNRKQMDLDNLSQHVHKSNKLTLLKQELKDATTKLCTLREDIDNKMLLKEMLVSKNNELSDVIKSLDDEAMAQRPDGICVSRKDVTELQETINKKREVCDKVKLEILTIQASLSELQKTENTIRLQQSEMLSHHHTKERIAGVAKFTGINDKLVATSKETASLNEMKARTLEDISVMVQEIASTLEVKQHELRPKIEELKVRRKKFQDLQKLHDREQANYHETLAALTNEELENDCSRLRNEWFEKISSSQLLSLKDELTLISIRHLGLEKERRAQKQRRSNEYISNQRAMFASLKALVEFKSKTTGEFSKQ